MGGAEIVMSSTSATTQQGVSAHMLGVKLMIHARNRRSKQCPAHSLDDMKQALLFEEEHLLLIARHSVGLLKTCDLPSVHTDYKKEVLEDCLFLPSKD